MGGRLQLWAQCISAGATVLAAFAVVFTAWLVKGQLDAALITLHVDSQYKLYEAVLSSSQALSDTADTLKTAKPENVVAIRQKLKVQAQAFDGLIAEVRSEHVAKALPDPGYFWILYQFCPAFKAAGFAYDGVPLNRASDYPILATRWKDSTHALKPLSNVAM